MKSDCLDRYIMAKKRVVSFRKKDLQLLKAYQSAPFEVGGIIDATADGIQRVAMMPGRAEGNSIDPSWYPNYSIIFHTHCGNPGVNFGNIVEHFSTTGEINVNALVQTISPADLYTTGIFFMEGRANMHLICAPEGVYFIYKQSDNFLKTPERIKLLKILSDLLDEMTEALLDKMVPALKGNFRIDRLAKFQQDMATKICKMINKYSNFIKVVFVGWDSEVAQKFLLEPINEDVCLKALRDVSQGEKPEPDSAT